jgi:hypothetical protein
MSSELDMTGEGYEQQCRDMRGELAKLGNQGRNPGIRRPVRR